MNAHVKEDLNNYKEFYRRHLRATAELARATEQASVVRQAQKIRARHGEQALDELSAREQHILRFAAYALEEYDLGGSDAATAQAIERLEASVFICKQVEDVLHRWLESHIRRLFGQDELESWRDRRECILSCLKGNSLAELREMTVARANHFSRYLATNAECEDVFVFAPSIVEENFQLEEQGLFYSLK